MRLSRREAIKVWVVSGVGLLAGVGAKSIQPGGDAVTGRQTGVVDFVNEGPVQLGVAEGNELDGRLYTDLSKIEPNNQLISTDRFYLRTRASQLLPRAEGWQISLGGLAERLRNISAASLSLEADAMGEHLMECSGNTRMARFGLLSATTWAGMRLEKLLANARPGRKTTRVLISGFDEYATTSVNSIPGASWIFSLEDIASRGAFLATHMGGNPLTADHGAPVRLVVPGWYGCACIKWVNRIEFVDDDVRATSQMREFAFRTQQDGVPELARDYKPASIEHAAMPIRVEQWEIGGKISYRVVGICWGGPRLLRGLQIRFNPEEDYVPVDDFRQTRNDPWTIWSHRWSPKTPGNYLIRLATEDDVPARRLNSGYYVREVEITEV